MTNQNHLHNEKTQLLCSHNIYPPNNDIANGPLIPMNIRKGLFKLFKQYVKKKIPQSVQELCTKQRINVMPYTTRNLELPLPVTPIIKDSKPKRRKLSPKKNHCHARQGRHWPSLYGVLNSYLSCVTSILISTFSWIRAKV